MERLSVGRVTVTCGSDGGSDAVALKRGSLRGVQVPVSWYAALYWSGNLFGGLVCNFKTGNPRLPVCKKDLGCPFATSVFSSCLGNGQKQD